MADNHPRYALGFDATADGATVALAIQLTPDGPMHIECAEVPPGVTEQQVRDLVEAYWASRPSRPAGQRVAEIVGQDTRPFGELVAEWTERHLRADEPGFTLAPWQRAKLVEAYKQGQVTTSSFISKPRSWVA